MAAAIVIVGVMCGGLGAIATLATGGTFLAAFVTYIVFGQLSVLLLIAAAFFRRPSDGEDD